MLRFVSLVGEYAKLSESSETILCTANTPKSANFFIYTYLFAYKSTPKEFQFQQCLGTSKGPYFETNNGEKQDKSMHNSVNNGQHKIVDFLTLKLDQGNKNISHYLLSTDSCH